MLQQSMSINSRGHLEIGGCDTVHLAREFGTPLYIMDEMQIRSRCQEYRKALSENYPSFRVAYAGKAFLSMAMCQLLKEEEMSLDVVSGGELYVALKSDFPPDKIYFHGNNKTRAELDMALEAGVGRFVVDSEYELELLNYLAASKHKRPEILVRVNPGVETHTHEYLKTGVVDSKFGVSIENGYAVNMLGRLETLKHLQFMGLHVHIGSEIQEVEPYFVAINRLVDFMLEIKDKLNLDTLELDLGGGLGINYTGKQDRLSISTFVREISAYLLKAVREAKLPVPQLVFEPGRSIVGQAGTTLYTVGTIKEIPGVRTYVSVDGGMTDNPRPALYNATYQAVIANKANASGSTVATIAGKCCESGDILIKDIALADPDPGDILAVFCTGAYNYSMASNYNLLLRPAVLFVKDGKPRLVIRRQELSDLLLCEEGFERRKNRASS